MRLTTEDAGFLDVTSTKPGKSLDFKLVESSCARAVKLAEDFWVQNHTDLSCMKLFVAAVHALFIAQNPRSLQFEKVMYLYAAIDACHKADWEVATIEAEAVARTTYQADVSGIWHCSAYGVGIRRSSESAIRLSTKRCSRRLHLASRYTNPITSYGTLWAR